MAKLFFRYGAMSSGKSAHLLLTNFNYIERGLKTIILTSAKDDRYGKRIIKSRAGLQAEAIEVDDTVDLFNFVFMEEPVDCILIDEVQFFTKEQIYQLSDIVDKLNIPVIAYGLRSDFKMEGFEASMTLLVIADEIEELKTICWCGKKATTNARLVDGKVTTEGEQVMIGDINYTSLCRKHLKEGKIK